MSGVTARQGAVADSPVFLRTPVCDDTNALLLAVSVLMALYHRDRTGQGQKVDLCLMNTGVLVNSDDFMRYKGKPERPLADRELYGLSAAYRLYRAEDGWIFVACELEEEWDLLKQVLGGRWTVQEFSFDRAKAVNPWDVELCRELEAEFARRTAKEWEKRLTDAGAPCVRVARDNQEGFSQNPQALSLGAVSKREHPEYSEVVQPGVLVEFSETPTAERPAAPILGEHTIEVLKELGYDESEIQNMEEAGYIATANSR